MFQRDNAYNMFINIIVLIIVFLLYINMCVSLLARLIVSINVDNYNFPYKNQLGK